MDNKKVLLSIKDLHVKFRVRGRILTAIRGISLDLYENESIAIVGESGSGKSVFTKTFAGMLDANGYISEGSIIFNDPELADTDAELTPSAKKMIVGAIAKLNDYSKLELGAAEYRRMLELESELKQKETSDDAEREAFDRQVADLNFQKTEIYNKKLTLDSVKEKEQIKEANAEIARLEAEIKKLTADRQAAMAARKKSARSDTAYMEQYNKEMNALKDAYAKKIKGEISEETKERNTVIAKEIYLSVARYNLKKRIQYYNGLLKAMKKAMKMGVELGHQGNPKIECGVCGEHGGDPDSVKMFHKLGLDYVSCSPYRVPLARLAAAQAALA